MIDRPRLERLRLDHAAALLDFERENRAYFAASIPDRGDEYFAEFDARHRELLAHQATGEDHLHVLVDDAGAIVGRINLVAVTEGSADLGYRIAERVAGQGVATYGVCEVLTRTATEYGLTELTAKTTLDNFGSRVVLERVGFVAIGEITLNGRPGLTYRRDLATGEIVQRRFSA